MGDISVVIHTKNAAKTLEKTLKSVLWCDDIVVMDMKSTDGTQRVAKKYTTRLYSAPVMEYADPVRNDAIKKAKHPWVLVIDADEELTEDLAVLLKEKAKQKEVHGYFLPRKNMIFGTWAKTGWWPDYIMRFFMKEFAEWPPGIHSQPVIEGETEYINPEERYALVHHHYEDVAEFVERMNRYTSIEAEQKPYDPDASFLRLGNDEFLRRFFAWKGYEQKTYGLALSLLQQCSFIISAVKRWEKAGMPEDGQVKRLDDDIDEIFQNLCYWIADMHVHTSASFLRRAYWRVRRKLKV